ncbi:MAG: shikimate kinase [Actinomycetota bacterium]
MVLDPANRAELRAAGVVVWLRAPVAELVARVGTGAGRPLLADDPVGALLRLERERDSAYGAAAHLVVDTTGLGVDPVVDRVLVEDSRAGGER